MLGLFRKRKRPTGAAGEDAAADYLSKAGVRILARNYRCAAGEIDLIGADSGTIVFFEVKTRSDTSAADPENNITPAKRSQLTRVARYWLARHRYPENAYRFDAISVVLPESGPPEIRRIVEAFVPPRG